MAKNQDANKGANAGGTVKVRLVKGLRGAQARHRLSVKALGLNKLNEGQPAGTRPDQQGALPGAGRGVIE